MQLQSRIPSVVLPNDSTQRYSYYTVTVSALFRDCNGGLERKTVNAEKFDHKQDAKAAFELYSDLYGKKDVLIEMYAVYIGAMIEYVPCKSQLGYYGDFVTIEERCYHSL